MTAPRSPAFAALEALNLAICQASGAGLGIDTPPDACAAYARHVSARHGEIREAIYAARLAPDAGQLRHYIDGIEAALARAVDSDDMRAVEAA
jgi:hypothetical protein